MNDDDGIDQFVGAGMGASSVRKDWGHKARALHVCYTVHVRQNSGLLLIQKLPPPTHPRTYTIDLVTNKTQMSEIPI